MSHYEEAERLLMEAEKWEQDTDECRRRGQLAVIKSDDRRADREHEAEARGSARKSRRCREHALIHAILAVNEPTVLANLVTDTYGGNRVNGHSS